MIKAKTVMFSIRVPEEAITCWLEHFFATVERVKDADKD